MTDRLQPPNIISLREWRDLESRGVAPQDRLLRKQYTPEIRAVEGDDRAVGFVITTGAVDRDGDTISPKGWRLTSYRKNPVVLWAHDYRGLPIARATSIKAEGDGVHSVAHFVEKELYPLAEVVLQMLKRRYLNATSVGFMPEAWERSEEEARRGGYDFTKQELLEYSVVPVPSNPEALVEMRSAGVDLTPLKAWAEELLDTWHEQRGIWLPRDVVERAFTIAAGERGVSLVPRAPAPEAPPAAPAPAPQAAAAANDSASLAAASGTAAAPALPVEPTPPAAPAPAPQARVYMLEDFLAEALRQDEPPMTRELSAEEALALLRPDEVTNIVRDALRPVVAEVARDARMALTGRLD